MRFWVVFRSERAVSTILPPYIMPNGTYERIKFFSDTLPLRYSVINSREFNPQQPASTIEKIIKFIHFPVSDSFDQKLPVSTFSRQLRSFINFILDSVEIPELRDPMLLFESRFRYCCQLPPWVSSTYYYLNLNLDSNFNIYFE